MALTIDKRKTAFLSMHFLNDLVHENGKFAVAGVAAHAKKTNCLSNTKKVLNACRRAHVSVIHVGTGPSEVDQILVAYMPVVSALTGVVKAGAFTQNTWGAEFHEDVKPLEGEFVTVGRGSNAFYASELSRILRLLNIKSLVLSGAATNMVVESTARYASDELYDIIVLRDCCASFNEDLHNFTLDNVLPLMATISNSEEFINALT